MSIYGLKVLFIIIIIYFFLLISIMKPMKTIILCVRVQWFRIYHIAMCTSNRMVSSAINDKSDKW